ncbi:hypothetical protein MHI32_01560 [Paenibacillus sp. FSL H7-0690]|uniref:hypothetical protein n=1 Tax=Paenibacillus sp. FSL H7-0690 TaxID=2921437 RepID=UPI0030EF2D0C
MEISEFQTKIEQLQYELNIENQRGGLKDAAKVERLEAQIAELTAELEKPEVDPVIARGEEEIALFGVPLGAYFATIADHVAVRSVVIPAFRQLINEKKDLEDGYHKLSESSEAESQRLNEVIEARDTEIATLKAALYESKLQAEDNASKRDNVYSELLEAKKTIDELNAKIAASTVTKEQIRTNLDGAAVVKKVKRVIYDVVYMGKWNEKFTAKYADTDESFEDYTLYKDTKYQEVQAEEAATFRTEFLAKQEQERNHEDMAQHSSVEDEPVTVPAFRDEDTNSATSGVDQADASSEVAGSSVEKRLEALELAVFGSVRDAA